MATVPKSFKQMCPSCEAMVPVRDPQLIGKKIDCPKCKYRFVVEEPAEDEAAEEPEEAPAKKKKGSDKVSAAKPAAKGGKAAAGVTKSKTSPKKGAAAADDEDRPSPKKKQKPAKSNMMLILGVGLALVALTAIVVCVFAIPWGDGGDKKNAANNNNNGGGMPPPPGSGGDAEKDKEKEKDKQPPPAEPVNATNLLPNDTQVVISYPMDRALTSSLRSIALENAGGFRPRTLEKQLGLAPASAPLSGVSRIITALNAKNDWVFTVVRTKKPVNEDRVKAELKLEPLPPMPKGKSGKAEVFLVRSELDGLGTLLLKANRDKDAFAVYFHEDKHTMIFADVSPLKEFLASDCKAEVFLVRPRARRPRPSRPTG